MLRFLAVLLVVLAPRLASARTIAIAYFDNTSGVGELEPLRKGLADMLITDLGNVQSLQIVEREKLNQVIDELKLSKSKFIDPRTAQKLGKGLAAELIMTGGYLVQGDQLRVDVRIVDVQTGKVAASEKVEGKKDDFFALEKDLVDILIKTLDVKLSSGERSKLRSNATQSFDAWQKYSAGLDAKDRGDAAEARRLFQAALDADPSYRAAKTATERLKVIFERGDAAKAADLDKQWKALDPKSPNFAHQVDQLLITQGNDADQLKKKVALLTFLVERDLTPQVYEQMSRVSLEIMALVWRFDAMPGADTLLPPVCEYLISRYPKDQVTPAQCKNLLRVFDVYRAKMPPAQQKANWEGRWKNATLDWEIAIRDAMPDILKLFKLCGQKVRRP